MIRNVIFDFDDTLAQTYTVQYARHSRVAQELGLPHLSKKQFYDKWGPPWEQYLRLLWPRVNVRKFSEAYLEHYGKQKLPLIPGVRQALRSLERMNRQMYVLTSRESRTLYHHLHEEGIHNRFHRIHAMEHAPFHKPDPRVFTHFLHENGLAARESLYVGDLLIDYRAASGAGVLFVGVLTGTHTKSQFLRAGLGAKYILPSVKELPHWLKKNGEGNE